jgi:hypothetical protein
MLQICQNVFEQIKSGKGGQIIFTTDKFVGSHDRIKKCLEGLGLESDLISVANGMTCPKSSDRQRISNNFNKGKTKVVIGNDGIIGQGMNLQEDTSGIHHATLPWTPADIIQRNGRGLRQGNQQDAVHIFTYFSKGSFDLFRHEALARKSDWIGDLWRGQANNYLNPDIDGHGALEPGDLAVLLSPDPETAKAELGKIKQAAMEAYHAKKRIDAYLLYDKVYKKQSAIRKYQEGSKMKAAVEAEIESAKALLLESEYFTHKELLKDNGYGSLDKEILILKELNQVFVVGDYVGFKKGDKERLMRIRHVRQSTRSISLTNNLKYQGGSYYRSNDYTPDQIREYSIKAVKPQQEEIDLARIADFSSSRFGGLLTYEEIYYEFGHEDEFLSKYWEQINASISEKTSFVFTEENGEVIFVNGKCENPVCPDKKGIKSILEKQTELILERQEIVKALYAEDNIDKPQSKHNRLSYITTFKYYVEKSKLRIY